MTDPDRWHFEREAARQGFHRVAGVDEAGRGPLAGPVVAAAVMLPAVPDLDGLKDSKKLSPARRAWLFQRIYAQAVAVGIGIVDPVEIDRRNILQATRCAMVMAIVNLAPQPDQVLIDGTTGLDLDLDLHQVLIPQGDDRSLSIAAASVVAKVTRDQLMARYDLEYPQYGFAIHKGYPTAAHRDAIRIHGLSAIHRRSFRWCAPVADSPVEDVGAQQIPLAGLPEGAASGAVPVRRQTARRRGSRRTAPSAVNPPLFGDGI